MTGTTYLAGTAVTLLADGENQKSGPIGLAVILVLCVICYFLFKSMSKHLKRVREDFPGDGQKRASGSPAESPPSPPPLSPPPSPPSATPPPGPSSATSTEG
ncbi:MAG: hypothetical protein QOE97_2347 [Pseudonocardiales bacterium]|nr:hypothetical protein [Pseudonocardiales bacterium]